MNLFKMLLEKLKASRVAQLLLAAVIVFFGGYVLGLKHKVPSKVEIHTVQDVELKKKYEEVVKNEEELKQQLIVAQNTITDLQTHRVSHTRTIHHKDGTTITDTTTTTDTDKNTKSSTDTSKTTTEDNKTSDNKTSTSDSVSHTDTKTVTTPMLKDAWYVGVSVGISLKGVSTPGLEAKYRVIGPFWLGASLDTSFSPRVGIGVSF